jgi:putative phosphoesterase
MMRVGVVGDIHGNYSGLTKALQGMGKVEELIFTGDGYREIARLEAESGVKVIGVVGNCDFYSEFASERIFSLGVSRIFLTHGHHYGVKQGLTRVALAGQSHGIDLVIFGHTHLPLDDLWQNVRLFNPGSLSMERSMGGPSYGVIEFDENGFRTRLCRL